MSTKPAHTLQAGSLPLWEQFSQDGETLFRISTGDGLSVVLSALGANLRSLTWKGRELTLGYANPSDYKTNPVYLGATVGRFANRIARGQASVGGRKLSLAQNNGENHLHGGPTGFQILPFAAQELSGSITFGEQTHPAKGVAFTLTSPDGHEGYPGTLDLEVNILVAEGGLLAFHYRAKSSADTLCNITNHTYWNLEGEGKLIHDHVLRMNCSSWMDAVDAIPTGKFVDLPGSVFDFSKPVGVGNFLQAAQDTVIVGGGKGVDHCFVVDPKSRRIPVGLEFEGRKACTASLRLGAELSVKDLAMDVWTTKPGIQLYTQNFGEGLPGRKTPMLSYRGLCLETQFFPDAPNQAEGYRAYGESIGYAKDETACWDARLKAGETYEELTIHQWRSI